MKEIWKSVKGYEGLYEVSSLGRVKNVKKSKFIAIVKRDKNSEYRCASLSKDGTQKIYGVHRLVAEAFLPNPENLPVVNHKDENPANNCVENLEWCTQQYNCTYGTRTQRIAEKHNKAVSQFDKAGNFIKTYKSVTEAASTNNFILTNIAKCCRGERFSANGYIWKYE